MPQLNPPQENQPQSNRPQSNRRIARAGKSGDGE
jgi:hypothetical protein